jgi:hypothetical protein
MQKIGITMTNKLAKGRIQMLPGSHLFPMEWPIETAIAIDTALKSMI